jgi:hypothetical protein
MLQKYTEKQGAPQREQSANKARPTTRNDEEGMEREEMKEES